MAGRPKKEWMPYEDAKLWVHRLRLPNYRAWLQYVKHNDIPSCIPRNPQITYGDDYISDGDFLGHKSYWQYDKAEVFVHNLDLKSAVDWYGWYDENQPQYIPKYPDQTTVYENEWVSWGQFLGTGTVMRGTIEYRSYLEAKKYAHSHKLKNSEQWIALSRTEKFPRDIPAKPDKVYDEWEGWDAFLGKNIADVLKTLNEDTQVLYLINEAGTHNTVVTVGVEKNGKAALLDRQRIEQFRIIKLFHYDSTKEAEIKQAILRNGEPWWEGHTQYLINNIYGLIADLQRILDVHM